jgi:glutathione S-transferase
MTAPIEVYAFATPNSVKVPIALEELGAAYTLHAVNVRKGEQKTPSFVAMNPNAKVPVIVDPEGPEGRPITIVESGAILVYLAEKLGGLLPASGTARVRCLEWLFFQVAGLGPMFGQAGYFLKSAPSRVDFAVERYSGEARRNVQILDGHLKERTWAAGETYTIADIALFGWIWRRAFAGVDLDDAPNVARWLAAMEARPAVQRAVRAVEALVPAA